MWNTRAHTLNTLKHAARLHRASACFPEGLSGIGRAEPHPSLVVDIPYRVAARWFVFFFSRATTAETLIIKLQPCRDGCGAAVQRSAAALFTMLAKGKAACEVLRLFCVGLTISLVLFF